MEVYTQTLTLSLRRNIILSFSMLPGQKDIHLYAINDLISKRTEDRTWIHPQNYSAHTVRSRYTTFFSTQHFLKQLFSFVLCSLRCFLKSCCCCCRLNTHEWGIIGLVFSSEAVKTGALASWFLRCQEEHTRQQQINRYQSGLRGRR